MSKLYTWAKSYCSVHISTHFNAGINGSGRIVNKKNFKQNHDNFRR